MGKPKYKTYSANPFLAMNSETLADNPSLNGNSFSEVADFTKNISDANNVCKTFVGVKTAEKMLTMSSTGIKLLGIIISEISKGDAYDSVNLGYRLCKAPYNLSRSSLYRGTVECMKNGIIAKMNIAGNWFFVNPQYVASQYMLKTIEENKLYFVNMANAVNFWDNVTESKSTIDISK